jgi:hypothetical protein
MLRVLRHYLPIRKAALILSETVLLSAVLTAALTFHLWGEPSNVVFIQLYERIPALPPNEAFWRCTTSAFLLAVLAQIAIAFNELYDVRVSGSRYDRAARFVESAGSALAIALVAVLVGGAERFGRVIDLPGLSLSQRVQVLVFGMPLGFTLLFGWRTFFHYLLRRVAFNERVLILGAGNSAFETADHLADTAGLVHIFFRRPLRHA